MSTTTPSPRETKPEEGAVASTTGRGLQGWLLILLFAIPMILLGCVSPFAIRLRIEQVGKSWRTSGQLYAISTAGSIVGTFLPVLLLIPNIGTYRTFFTFAVALLLVSIAGLVGGSRGTAGDHWHLSVLPTLLRSYPPGQARRKEQGPPFPAPPPSPLRILMGFSRQHPASLCS